MQTSRRTLVSNERNGGIPSIIELNVGGQFYTTSLATLLGEPESLLSNMFSGRQRISRDTRGRFFIDRDGSLFRYVLDFLRNNNLTLPENFMEIDRLLLEAEYYQLKEMAKALKLHSVYSDRSDSPSPRQSGGYITLSVRGTFAFGRDGLADIKFRKLQRILVCGNVALSREVFGDSLNETRDPDRDQMRYTNRFFLKHNSIEKAFDNLRAHHFRLITSAAGGAGYDPETEETKWNHFTNFVFCKEK